MSIPPLFSQAIEPSHVVAFDAEANQLAQLSLRRFKRALNEVEDTRKIIDFNPKASKLGRTFTLREVGNQPGSATKTYKSYGEMALNGNGKIDIRLKGVKEHQSVVLQLGNTSAHEHSTTDALVKFKLSQSQIEVTAFGKKTKHACKVHFDRLKLAISPDKIVLWNDNGVLDVVVNSKVEFLQLTTIFPIDTTLEIPSAGVRLLTLPMRAIEASNGSLIRFQSDAVLETGELIQAGEIRRVLTHSAGKELQVVNRPQALPESINPLLHQLDIGQHQIVSNYSSAIIGSKFEGGYSALVRVGGELHNEASLEHTVTVGSFLNDLNFAKKSVAIGADIPYVKEFYRSVVINAWNGQIEHLAGSVLIGLGYSALPGRLNNVIALGSGALNDAAAARNDFDTFGTIAVGRSAHSDSRLGDNIAIGCQSLTGGVSATSIALGHHAFAGARSAIDSVAIGKMAARHTDKSVRLVAIGGQAAFGSSTFQSVAIGYHAMAAHLHNDFDCSNSIAIGAFTQSLTGQDNSVAIGTYANSFVDNNIQLGWTNHTVSSYGQYYRRMGRDDVVLVNDKTVPRLGLKFIKSLKAQMNYRNEAERYYAMDTLVSLEDPEFPETLNDISFSSKTVANHLYDKAARSAENIQKQRTEYSLTHKENEEQNRAKIARWQNGINRVPSIEQRSRKQMAENISCSVIGEDLAAALKELNIENFEGLRTFKDALNCIRYDVSETSLVGPLVNAIGELEEYVHSEDFTRSIEERVMKRIAEKPPAALVEAVAASLARKLKKQ